MIRAKNKHVSLVLLIAILFGVLLPPTPINAANETLLKTEAIEYNASDENLRRSHQSVFHNRKQIETKRINVDAGAGKIITKIVLKKDGQAVRTINVNARTYNNTISLQGEPVPVKSTQNSANGGWFAWQRCIACTSWTPGSGNYSFANPPDSTTGRETIGGIVRDKWPGKRVIITVPYRRDNGYVSAGSVDYGSFSTKIIDDETATLTNANPMQIGTNVSINRTTTVTTPDGTSGNTDSSTQITGFKVNDLDTASISYLQDHGHEGYRRNLQPDGSAAMMYYFAIFNFDIKSFSYRYPNVYEVYTKDGDPDDGGQPGNGSGSCTYNIDPPTLGSSPQTQAMNPSATGVIKADDANNAPYSFDVLQGIPTSEHLYAITVGYNYLFQHTFGQMNGQVTYSCNIEVTYLLKWKEKQPPDIVDGKEVPVPDVEKSVNETKTYSFTFTKPYSYWTIRNLEVYEIEQAIMRNDALPGGSVTLTPAGYTPPTLNSSHSDNPNDHVNPSETGSVDYSPPDVDGGYSKPSPPDDTGLLKGMAEGQTQDPKVKNDKVEFNNQKIMDDAEVSRSGPTPSKIPNPTMIGSQVLYRNGLRIPSTFLNRHNVPSSGTIYYKLLPNNINGGSDKQFPINSINSVTVHTPTVIYANASDDAAHNQKTVPNYNRRAFILDRNIKIYMPTSGQHRNIPGYGNRDYAKYIKAKQVRFEFDVYNQNRTTFYPAGTWIDIPVPDFETTFFLPVWVEEGNYNVSYRSFAENSPNAGFTTERNANLDLANHVATDTIPVEVIGRVYDFRVTDIADPAWETVFRTAKGSSTPRGTSYWVGPQGIDGAPNGSFAPYVLPILRGSHPVSSHKSVAVKTGYAFKFDLKTKGNMYEDRDAIRITPTFYFQDNNPATPANRVEVDLYYHSDTKKFVKIGSTADVEKRNITLDARLRNVPAAQIVNTAGSIYDMNSGWTSTRQQYINAFIKRSKEPTYVGGYDVQILPSSLRTFINTFDRPSSASASPARVNASIQQWYGEYSIPAAVYAVRKGTDLAEYGRRNRLDEKSPIFLKNGYITVNFNIETIRNGNLNSPHLQYIHGPLNNQWWDMEGFDNTDGRRDHLRTDPYGVQFRVEDGDVIFYDANRSSYDDYSPNGTH